MHFLRKLIREMVAEMTSGNNPDSSNGNLYSRSVSSSGDNWKSSRSISGGMKYHLSSNTGVDDNVYRPGTKEFFDLFNEARDLWKNGQYKATDSEIEFFESDIGSFGMFEGKKVPLDFPMWDEDLNESFADSYEKNKWVELSKQDLDDHPEIYDEIFRMIDLSYAYIGGHANYKSSADIKNDDDISIFALIDVDDDDEADAVVMTKQTKFGQKSLASGTDGSLIAKKQLKAKILQRMSQRGYYAEVSDKTARFLIDNEVSSIQDESTVRKILGGKQIEWFGDHPDGLFPGVYGWYSRSIGGQSHTKIMVGNPIVTEAKYKGKDVVLGAKGAKRSGGRAHVYVKDPKTGNIRKVSFGSGMPDAMGDSPKHKARRKSFAARHQCAKKKDKLSAGYWACRATKMFGRNVPGWW